MRKHSLTTVALSTLFATTAAMFNESAAGAAAVENTARSSTLRGSRILQDRLPCPNGVVGILGILTGEAMVCCDIECGECGGSGCGRRPGGVANCCIGGPRGIVATSGDCADSGDAPCVITTEEAAPAPTVEENPAPTGADRLPCPNGVAGILGILTGEAMVCCDIECGECGGSGCGRRPGGVANCCIGGPRGIVATSDDCADSGVAPCVISTEGS